jgi:lambda repressor-like predicted transcriptional regulator
MTPPRHSENTNSDQGQRVAERLRRLRRGEGSPEECRRVGVVLLAKTRSGGGKASYPVLMKLGHDLVHRREGPASVSASVPTRGSSRERRDSARPSSSRSSSSSDSEGEQDEPGETPGRIIETRLAELGLSYREVCALTEGIVDPSTLSRVVSGKVQRPYARTKAALAWALKMHVSEIWPARRRAT